MLIPNFVESVNQRIENQHFNGVHRLMENLNSCCFFFDLKLGCKLITLLESISGLWHVYYSYNDLYCKDRSLAPEWLDVLATKHDSHFTFFLGLVAFFCSQLLLAGVVFERKVCVLLWIYVTAFFTLVFMFYTLVFDCIPERMLFDVFSLGLQVYFVVIALAYYMKMRRVEHTNDEFEVLFTASEA